MFIQNLSEQRMLTEETGDIRFIRRGRSGISGSVFPGSEGKPDGQGLVFGIPGLEPIFSC